MSDREGGVGEVFRCPVPDNRDQSRGRSHSLPPTTCGRHYIFCSYVSGRLPHPAARGTILYPPSPHPVPLDPVVPHFSHPHRAVPVHRDPPGRAELPGAGATLTSNPARLPKSLPPPPVGIPHLDPVVLISGTARGKRYRGHGGVSVSGGFPSPSSGQRPLPAAQQPVPARWRPRMSSLNRTCTETHPAPYPRERLRAAWPCLPTWPGSAPRAWPTLPSPSSSPPPPDPMLTETWQNQSPVARPRLTPVNGYVPND